MSFQPYRTIQPDPDYIPDLQFPVGPAKTPRQVLSKEDWEELKPLIQRLYIEEKKTFRRICTILSHSHGFTPTKRQFGAKIHQWGFKKNTTREERRRIVRGPGGQSAITINGKEIDRKTRERWEKEFQASHNEDLDVSSGMFFHYP